MDQNRPMQSICPFTGELLATHREITPSEVEAKILQADLAFQVWKQTSFSHRSQRMHRLREIILQKREVLALLMVKEMGKVLREALAEIDKCAWVCGYYADHAEEFLAHETVMTEAAESFVSFQPLGTILAVMPWNFPFWQVFRFLAPTLMAGNSALLKHASNVQGCATAIEQLVKEAGFPDHLFDNLAIGSARVRQVIAHPLVKAVTLTGSTPAGKSVAEAAGAHLKKSLLELGGSDPYLILEDADISEAARLCVASRLLNAGQSCIGAKRFIIADAVYEDFKALFVRGMEAANCGDPMDPATTIGPLARLDLRNELHQQVVSSVAQGAIVLLGGFIPEGKAACYPATVLENVLPGMAAYHEELFGPVAVLHRFRTLEEGIRLANDTVFGLGAGVFTADLDKGKLLAEKGLEAGCVFVNDFVKSDPRLPFGGIKESGYGRELAAFGIREFVNVKTVVVK
ncbi:MAG: NAD-dependent succinate-semialdehyde dehydrogenase [Marinilabiliales bacterium]|nr:NAD-dependent succinate-semialdehyde dehydrogenase [Marinilabiliales bacterium]